LFFFSLGLFLVLAWSFPWWMSALAAFALGCCMLRVTVWPLLGAAFLANAALAYVQDGSNYGLVSQRLAGLFNLPAPALIFLVMGIWGAATALVCVQAGRSVRSFLVPDRDKTV
jgi:hypothetical protein